MSDLAAAIAQTRERMQHVFSPNQVLGRTRAIGCVAVEITQRCNLDCTLCYLSEHSEDVEDIPMEIILNRLEEVRQQYGAGTNVQITGGDPTLRKHYELIEIVQYASSLGLFPALFTNGIAASRKLLKQLADAGLTEVAFHVDLTQEREGYSTEQELNEIRLEYIERARGLGINVLFNTTVFKDNFNEVPALAKFFLTQTDVVSFASFQLQADTGRGVLRQREDIINIENIRRRIHSGIEQDLVWDVAQIGHPHCHSYSPNFVINGKPFAVMKDKQLMADFLRDSKSLRTIERLNLFQLAWRCLKIFAKKPIWLVRLIRFVFEHLWRVKKELLEARFKVNRISFFVHNFMDAENLDQERVDACSFMVATNEGPVSMCAHNAKRDDYILQPLNFHKKDGTSSTYIPIAQKQ